MMDFDKENEIALTEEDLDQVNGGIRAGTLYCPICKETHPCGLVNITNTYIRYICTRTQQYFDMNR